MKLKMKLLKGVVKSERIKINVKIFSLKSRFKRRTLLSIFLWKKSLEISCRFMQIFRRIYIKRSLFNAFIGLSAHLKICFGEAFFPLRICSLKNVVSLILLVIRFHFSYIYSVKRFHSV